MTRIGTAQTAKYGRVVFRVSDLIRYCSQVPDAPSAFRYAIGKLIEARPKRPQGRPRSGKANGPHIRRLREEAGLTQRALIDAIEKRSRADRFTVKTLQRYESSEAASPANLEIIAAMLSRKLGRAVPVGQLTKKAKARRQAAKKRGK